LSGSEIAHEAMYIYMTTSAAAEPGRAQVTGPVSKSIYFAQRPSHFTQDNIQYQSLKHIKPDD